VSRSRRPKCTTGRGCWCCGDAGAVRRRREALGWDAVDVGLLEHGDPAEDGAWAWDPIAEVYA
jgi:hypothetical protein